jgi:hypothetical protein
MTDRFGRIRWRRFTLCVVLTMLTVRCAHSPQTRVELECEKQANRCLRDCVEPRSLRTAEPDGCATDIRTDCEQRCQAPCEGWRTAPQTEH